MKSSFIFQHKYVPKKYDNFVDIIFLRCYTNTATRCVPKKYDKHFVAIFVRRMYNMYYKVYAKCGHVGIRKCINIWYAIEADSKKDAAAKVRWFPRVKHHHKDAILDVIEISKEEYIDILNKNNDDPYLKCHSRQEQNAIKDIYNRIIDDQYNLYKEEHIKKELVVYRNKLIRNVRKYAKFNHYFDAYKEELNYVN